MLVDNILKRYWNIDTFRPLQQEIIQSVLENNDTLALMPTGGGKSLCFQIPALLKPGICIVVSPLIALMKDQVENLKAKGIVAVAIVSGMGKREIDIVLDNCVLGDIKLLYISPERLFSELVKERIRYMNVNLIAIDEAHCISQWGYDFRPSYLHLATLRELHPSVPVIALTATATKRVIIDIQEKLGFKKACVFSKSFERKNLSYVVIKQENKLGKLLEVVNNVPGSGIVYVRNRRKTQEVSYYLNVNKVSADYYHAGLDTQIRISKQDQWKSGQTRVMIATNAFGMGIDKSNVRFVVHLDLPESLEAYYQEAGRGGRDEQKAYAVVIYHEADKLNLLKKLQDSLPSIEEIKQMYHHLGNYYQLAHGAGKGLLFDFDIVEFCTRFKLNTFKTLNTLKFLERDGYISLSESVFLPSRLQMVASEEQLYHFQVAEPIYDRFIKTILRLYGGVFDRLVAIKENEIAKRVNLTNDEVVSYLNKLQAQGLLHYLPQTDKPQLQWLQARVDFKHLLIDRKYITERSHIQQQQVDSVIAYVEKSVCRSLQLLLYLNDAEADVCGICDICLEQKRKDKQTAVRDQIIDELMFLLNNDSKLLEELVFCVKVGTQDEKLTAIRMLIDAGKIQTDGIKYYLNPSDYVSF